MPVVAFFRPISHRAFLGLPFHNTAMEQSAGIGPASSEYKTEIIAIILTMHMQGKLFKIDPYLTYKTLVKNKGVEPFLSVPKTDVQPLTLI